MLTSMTGHGQASAESEIVRAVAEVRSVNNRYLKITINCDLDTEHQAKLESLVKEYVNRGSVNLRLKTQFLDNSQSCKLNEGVLRAYWLQLSEIAGSSQSVNLESLLTLPGIIEDNVDPTVFDKAWPTIELAVKEALDKLNQMRSQEGQVMMNDMLDNCQGIAKHLENVKTQAPKVTENYAQRLTERINKLLEGHNTTVETTDIVREVGIFAEKADISEETVRLGSHIEQFNQIANTDESNGKKLEFLVQEILRETNTIGSKANDVEIANHVVEIKTLIERIREMVQNVE